MADSKVEIWNMALGHIKANVSILSPTESGFEADQCRIYYDTCVNAVLRAMHWSFAKKQLALSLTGTAPSGWDYQYTYPSDCLKARRIYNPADPKNTTLPAIEYEIAKHPTAAGKVIWTDTEDAELIYTQEITDTTLFDAQFDMALSYYLAAKLAMPITGDRNKAQDMMTMYRFELSGAQASDDNEEFEEMDQNAEWIRDRA